MKIKIIGQDKGEKKALETIPFGTVFRGELQRRGNTHIGVWLKVPQGVLNLTYPFDHYANDSFTSSIVENYKELGVLNVELEEGG